MKHDDGYSTVLSFVNVLTVKGILDEEHVQKM